MDSWDGRGQLTVLLHASIQALLQPAGGAVAPLGLADLTASSEGARETGAFVDCSPVETDVVRGYSDTVSKNLWWGFPGGPGVSTWCFHCQGPGFNPWLGN